MGHKTDNTFEAEVEEDKKHICNFFSQFLILEDKAWAIPFRSHDPIFFGSCIFGLP